ncbi:MAG: phosphatase PAP2 family protein [Bdellovibrionales bacterium]
MSRRVQARNPIVRDVWSRRWSFPQSARKAGEAPEAAALRGFREATGISGRVIAPAARLDAFQIFECAADVALPVLATPNPTLFHIPPPPRLKNQIDKVAVMDLATALGLQWRTASHRDSVLSLAPSSSSSTFNVTVPAAARVGPYYTTELSWIRGLQSLRSVVLDAAMVVFNFLGEEKFYYLALPFFWLCVDWTAGWRLTMLLIVSTAINGLLKDGFELPRPQDFDARLALWPATGFGFPSGHTQTATVFFGFVLFELRRRGLRSRLWLSLGLLLIAEAAVARMYWGAHFLVDLLGGWLVGSLVLAAYSYLPASLPKSSSPPGLRWTLPIWCALSLLLILWRPHPESVSLSAMSLGILIGVRHGQLDLITETAPSSLLSALFRWGMGTLGLFMIPPILDLLFPAERTLLVSLALRCATYLLMGFWISWLSFRLLRAWAKNPLHRGY